MLSLPEQMIQLRERTRNAKAGHRVVLSATMKGGELLEMESEYDFLALAFHDVSVIYRISLYHTPDFYPFAVIDFQREVSGSGNYRAQDVIELIMGIVELYYAPYSDQVEPLINQAVSTYMNSLLSTPFNSSRN